MKRLFVIILTVIVFLAIPALAGFGITALWNNIITDVCGFAAINFLQGLGLFFLGQLLSGGFIIALFLLFGSLHGIIHSREHWRNHWHNMTDEQRRDFILRRREHFGFPKHPYSEDNAAER